jgi:glycosyltransferase involved in cell wall biosynthesis
MYLASVIIPAYGRQELLDRAVISVIRQSGSDMIEIIVVDDGSQPQLERGFLRSFDKLIRGKGNSGAAISRNIGIDNASGEWIFLLDSDDEYVSVDFENLNQLSKENLYYSSIDDGNGAIFFPDSVDVSSFFSCILFKYPGILQTSSLFFHSSSFARFDESLPKHQDWDFVYFQFLIKGRVALRSSNLIYFDKSDKNSLSRRTAPEKSIPWYKKISECVDSPVWVNNFRIRFLGVDGSRVGFFELGATLLVEFLFRRIGFLDILKILYRRFGFA